MLLNLFYIWSLCMRSIYSTPSTYRYKIHYTNLVLLIRNHNKIISKHFFVIHISLSFSDSNITISTIEMEVLAYLLHEKLNLADYVMLKDIENINVFRVQYFEFIITNIKISDLYEHAIINSSSVFGSIFEISENTIPISIQISLISL